MKIAVMQLGSYGTNCYIVWDETTKNAAVIDPGDQSAQVQQALDKEGLHLQMILLTHAHFDHIGAVEALQQASGCKVYVHRAEETLPLEMTGVPLHPTDYYEDGDTVSLDSITFRVLHTPGHTPGSVCLIADDVMFSGDTLFAGSCGRTDFPGSSWMQMESSLRRLHDLPGDYTVLPGHMGSSTLDRERKANFFMMQAVQG
jgi:hydroxyacylglutathione hydrolase